MIRLFFVLTFIATITNSKAQNKNESLNIIEKKVGFGYTQSNHRTIDAVIVHSTF